MKISVVGMGGVGAATAFSLVARSVPHELVLVGRTPTGVDLLLRSFGTRDRPFDLRPRLGGHVPAQEVRRRLCDRGFDPRLALGGDGLVRRLGRDDPRLGLRVDELLSREALGTPRPHLVEAEDDAARRRVGVEPFDDPLCSAQSGSTRAPNQVS